MRLAEAEALLSADLYSGAYYLAGYSVECALKAAICKQTQQFDFPPGPDLKKTHYSHILGDLVRTAALDSELRRRRSENPVFDRHWLLVTNWSEEKRYEGNVSFNAAQNLIGAIKDPQEGVLPWIQQHW